jgi:hypothetical protein
MTLPDIHQDRGFIWFWTDGQWSNLDLIAHAAALEAAYAIVVTFDWALFVNDLKSGDHRGRHQALQLASFLLHDSHDTDDVVRAMNAPSFVRWNVAESDEALTASGQLLDLAAQLQGVFDRGMPRLEIDDIAMTHPGIAAFRGMAGPLRKLRYLMRDVWQQRPHEEGPSKAAIEVARQYVTDRSYDLSIRVKAIDARATKNLALAFEVLHRLEARGRLAHVEHSLELDIPVVRGR